MIAVDVVAEDDTCWSGPFVLGDGVSGFMGNMKSLKCIVSSARNFEGCVHYQMV
jgi:hypothetical protein